MTAADFRRMALSFDGVEEGSHMGAVDFRVGGHIFATLASVDHWVIADLVGKGRHTRTVPMPNWVKSAVDAWTTAAHITRGPVFRAINKARRV
jgi:hypothetical protein